GGKRDLDPLQAAEIVVGGEIDAHPVAARNEAGGEVRLGMHASRVYPFIAVHLVEDVVRRGPVEADAELLVEELAVVADEPDECHTGRTSKLADVVCVQAGRGDDATDGRCGIGGADHSEVAGGEACAHPIHGHVKGVTADREAILLKVDVEAVVADCGYAHGFPPPGSLLLRTISLMRRAASDRLEWPVRPRIA